MNSPITYGHGDDRHELHQAGEHYYLGCHTGREHEVAASIRALQVPVGDARDFLLVCDYIKLPDALRSAVRKKIAEEFADAVRFFTPMLQDKETGLHVILTDELIVQFCAGVTHEVAQLLAAKHGVILGEASEFVPNEFTGHVQEAIDLQTLTAADALDLEEGVVIATPRFMSEIRR